MARNEFITYQGKTILFEDFSNLSPGPEMFETIATAQQIVTRQPPKSVLVLLDATGVHFDADTLAAFKQSVLANKPFVKCAVVFGVSGLLNIALNAVSNIAGENFKSFPDKTSALEYLFNQ